MKKKEIGLIGLAVMGQNLALNIEKNGYSVVVNNRTTSKIEEYLNARCKGKDIYGAHSLKELAESLERPRKIMLMVKAGNPVDETINQLIPFLDEGDVIIDGGNSHFTHTDRRIEMLAGKGILFMGTGISGGEEGALNGPSIMPGGDEKAYSMVEDIFKKIAAKSDGKPCVAYMGRGSAGHFVKMVHNGVEYGDMQIIAEAYHFMKQGLGLNNLLIADTFEKWKKTHTGSYLIDITADVLRKKDEITGNPLVEMILDSAAQKGTGRWTSQAALDLNVPLSVIDSAVFARNISALLNERQTASQMLKTGKLKIIEDSADYPHLLRESMLLAKIISYAQGFSLLKKASEKYDYGLKLNEIARIWKAGCIIRAEILNPIEDVFRNCPQQENLLVSSYFSSIAESCQLGLRKVVSEAVLMGIPTPALSSAVNYYDSYRSQRLPASLIQAQRDYFGAHGYERIDMEGSFHTDWLS